MIIDIPDAGIILVAVLAFLSGLVTLYLYNKTRSVGVSEKIAPTNSERVDYYEKELIDMKIRLDTMELDDESLTSPNLPKKKVRSLEKPETEFVVPKSNTSSRVPNMSFEDSLTHVLKLITSGPMTSRDVEVTFGKSREHVSRLMKKLFEGDFVSRDASARPYRYTITEKGRERIDSGEGGVVYAVSQ